MKAMTALIQREYLEHKGAFFYAPVVLIAVPVALVMLSMIFAYGPAELTVDRNLSSMSLFHIGFASIGAMWSIYLFVVLFFYYSDSFSADLRNNSMLFWKSMPQPDIKILTAKALAGVTILPALIMGFSLISMALAYLLSFPMLLKLGVTAFANPLDVLRALFGMWIASGVFLLLMILWYAPFMALVAGLSVLVKRWAIPAAILLCSALVVIEKVFTFGIARGFHPIRSYLVYRLHGFDSGTDLHLTLTDNSYLVPFRLIGEMLANYDWSQMGVGVLFAIVVVCLASEYRRRRLDS